MSAPRKFFAAALLAMLLAACASTPHAPADRDAEAKAFYTHPSTASVYVYRDFFNRDLEDSVLYIDNRLIGSTLPGTFYRIYAVPGRHVLHGIGIDAGRIEIDARPGELHFVRLDVVAGTSRFTLEPEQVGRTQLRACCAMLENWAPGQRPLLW